MRRILLLVGLGGFIGSVARYLTTQGFFKLFPVTFPVGTFAVNIIGSFILGVVIGLSIRYDWFTPEWRFFLATGVCGGYTTFSSFTLENVSLIQSGNYLTFGLYILASVFFGLLAVWVGLTLLRVN